MSHKPIDLHAIRHSFAHLLAAAILKLQPDAKPTIGPATEDGFYYDFDLTTPVGEEDFKSIEKEMRRILKTWQEFSGKEVSAAEARSIFLANPYKLELIDAIEKKGEAITLYRSGDFEDLCRGGHAETITLLHPDAFKLTRVAGAYWRGDETQKMLTRISGYAFENKEALEAHIAHIEEAKKRDHRKLGRELDLFTFSDLVGPGLPLYTPKGTLLRDILSGFSEELQRAHGFEKVWIPHITKTDLYKTSGHWDKFGHELFLVKSQETQDEFVLKPMNCPHHTQIYASRPRSYRDLPIRYMETTTCYRDEKTGELSGLTRVRSLTQDDAHIFCTMDQIESEFEHIMHMIETLYGALGLSFRARLSYRDATKPEAYLGSDADWQRAESTLETIAKKLGLDYFIAPGEAAFYGPKIDILVTDALGREWQCATEQLDFVQPSRFGLEYTDADGSKKTPVMIHKVLLGTLDRFLGVYIEHTAGNFPLWLAPEQVRILPIGEGHQAYAESLASECRQAALRVSLDASSESLGKRIRSAKLQKIPYLIVVGDKEIETQTLSLESRDQGQQGSLTLSDALAKLQKEIQSKGAL
jgi:threonyl-tRNA synthetase